MQRSGIAQLVIWTTALLGAGLYFVLNREEADAAPVVVPSEPTVEAVKVEDDDLGEPDEVRTRDAFAIKADQIIARLDREYGKGFFRYYCDDGIMPRPYLIAAEAKENVDPETQSRGYAEIFENLYRIFYEEYGNFLGLKPVAEPVPVLIFDSKDAYEKVFKEKPELNLSDPEFVAGYYRPWSGEMIQWGQADLWSVMFHEGTHQLVDFSSKEYNTSQLGESPWFQEGIAEFMGGHTRKMAYSEEKQDFITEFTLGQFLQGRFSDIQAAIASGDYLPLKDLTHMSFMKFKDYQNNQSGSSANQRVTGLVYSQGWAFVMFLNKHNEGAYKPLFDEYFAREIRGEGGGATFAEIFSLETDEDWADLDEEFKVWVNTDLRRMRRNK